MCLDNNYEDISLKSAIIKIISVSNCENKYYFISLLFF